MAKDTDDKVSWIKEKVEEVAETIHKIDKEVSLQKAAFDDHLEQDERMFQEFRRMNDILQQNTDSLKEHMHRTDMLEGLITRMDERFSPIEMKHTKDMVIAEYRAERKQKIAKWLVFIAKVAGGITAVITIVMTIKSLTGH